ncbi:MAG: hypothetical protein JSW55_10470 [Chloroflexota bacterium]|nr:MAG: hypothetical protein JSW55_10470 [Chloroflexota bacterium]
MKILALSPMSRLRRLFLLAILAVIALSLLPLAVAQADECLYEVQGECLENPEYTTIPVLQKYLVMEQVNNCQRIYDVWITATRPQFFDAAADQPMAEFNQSLIRALGTIEEHDLKTAINQGLVREVSRTVLDERCGSPVITEPAPTAPALPDDSAWRLEIAATDVLTTYVLLQSLASNEVVQASSEAERALVPEGKVATFFVADTVNMRALIEHLNLP